MAAVALEAEVVYVVERKEAVVAAVAFAIASSLGLAFAPCR